MVKWLYADGKAKMSAGETYVVGLTCIGCGEQYPYGTIFHCRKCSSTLATQYDLDAVKKAVSKEELREREPGVWRYRELLPVRQGDRIVTLGEGGTPLIRCERLSEETGLSNLLVKDETRNPSGSFKDRFATVLVSHALGRGVRKVFTATSGNAGAALACYAARAGMRCVIIVYMGEQGSKVKLAQCQLYGATVVTPVRKEEGQGLWSRPRDIYKRLGRLGAWQEAGLDLWRRRSRAVYREAYEKNGWYPAMIGGVNPNCVEGYKTISYEICQSLGWKAPDAVIVPTQSGDNLVGEWRGFKELHEMGWIDEKPRMVAALLSQQGRKPRLYGDACKQAVEESGGIVGEASAEEGREYAELLAAREGILVEYNSSSLSVACAAKLRGEGILGKNDVVACIATGHGMKLPNLAEEIYGKPIEIAMGEELDFLRQLAHGQPTFGEPPRPRSDASPSQSESP